PTREGVLRQIVTKALPPVSWRNRSVPRDLEAVVHRASAKDPDDRYQGAADFASDLQAWLDGKPVAALPYRHRIDEREIAAERPGSVVFVSFVFFLGSMVTCMFGFIEMIALLSRIGLPHGPKYAKLIDYDLMVLTANMLGNILAFPIFLA